MADDHQFGVESVRFTDLIGVYVMGPDEVEFRTGIASGGSFVVTDPERRGVLGRITHMILTHETEGGREFNSEEQEVVAELMPQLIEAGIVEAVGEFDRATVDQSLIDSTSTELGAQSRIGLVGHGKLAAVIWEHLRKLGYTDIKVVQSSSVATLPRDHSDVARADGTPLTQASLDSIQRPSSETEWANLLSDCDRLVVAQDCFEPEELATINEVALRVDLPWTLVCFDGHEGWIGPTFVPGQTACFSCFRRRLFSSVAVPKYVMGDGHSRLHRVASPWSVGAERHAWLSLVGSMFALDFAGTGRGDSFTIGQLLVVNRLSMTFHREAVLRLPRCASCSPRNDSPNLNVFSHILGWRDRRS